MGDSLGRIQAIVGRLLDFGRPRPLALKAEPVKGLAQDVVRLVGPALRQREITLVELDEGLGQATVLADRLQVGQALLNLVLNALYVTAAGGQVRLRLRRRAGAVGIAVEDDGPGIPVELRARVLDPFFSTKPEGEGTGLGLSVTRTIVDAHEGELAFDFPERGGTVVTVWLREAAPA
jgi:signal transduction histidine kinase